MGRPAAEAGPRIGLSASRLVLAGDLTANASMVSGAAVAFSDHRPSILVMDLPCRTFVLAPQIRPHERRIVLIGELDLATAPILAGALTFALHREPARVVIDLRRLAFIDARSAGAIAVASERMAGWGGRLAARMPGPAVRRVFECCGLGDLLTPRESRDSGRSSAAVALR